MENEELQAKEELLKAAKSEKEKIIDIINDIMDDIFILKCRNGIHGLTIADIPEEILKRRGKP